MINKGVFRFISAAASKTKSQETNIIDLIYCELGFLLLRHKLGIIVAAMIIWLCCCYAKLMQFGITVERASLFVSRIPLLARHHFYSTALSTGYLSLF